MPRHSQSSIELILLLAALFAFLAAFVPAINSGRALADYAAVSRLQESAFSRIAEAASQASVLGNGNSFSLRLFLPAERTTISFDDSSSALEMSFASRNRTSNSSRELSFPVKIDGGELGRGTCDAVVAAEGAQVTISFAHEK